MEKCCDILESIPGAVADAKHQKNKHRKALLLLIGALGATVTGLILTQSRTLIGQLAGLTNDSGNIPVSRLMEARFVIKSAIERLAKDAYFEAESQIPALARIAVESVGADESRVELADGIIRKSLTLGARGMGLEELYATAFLNAMQGVASAIQRGAVSGDTLAKLTPGIEKALNDILANKLQWSNYQQMSFAAMQAGMAVAGNTVTGYIWRLGARERHCKICTGRDGTQYAVNDPVLNELGAVHTNCGCWGEVVYA